MIVVDASVWVSRLVPQDVHHAATREWFKRSRLTRELWIAPALLLPELAGAISRRTGEPSLAQRAVSGVEHISPLRLVPVEQRLAREAARLAAELGLRGADAIYVALAYRLGIPLLTWDREQQERARKVVAVQAPD